MVQNEVKWIPITTNKLETEKSKFSLHQQYISRGLQFTCYVSENSCKAFQLFLKFTLELIFIWTYLNKIQSTEESCFEYDSILHEI